VYKRQRFRNEVIIVGHFSTRYHPQQVHRYLEKRLPDHLKSRIKIWI
jgi:ribonuclease Z